MNYQSKCNLIAFTMVAGIALSFPRLYEWGRPDITDFESPMSNQQPPSPTIAKVTMSVPVVVCHEPVPGLRGCFSTVKTAVIKRPGECKVIEGIGACAPG